MEEGQEASSLSKPSISPSCLVRCSLPCRQPPASEWASVPPPLRIVRAAAKEDESMTFGSDDIWKREIGSCLQKFGLTGTRYL